MSEKETGGPAFPTKRHNPNIMQFEHFGGMTLRDYFAAKALKTYSDDTEEQMVENAIKAYKQADAMLKVREA